MARIARVVVPHYPHHVTQRGSRRQQTFFSSADYRMYIKFLVRFKNRYKVEILAYCLMPNHVHFVAIPENEDGLASCFSRTHRDYALEINQRNGWQGHLWQERFRSFVMDEDYLLSVVRYTELNPVRAALCAKPEDWCWSSARAHLQKSDDQLVNVKPMLERVDNWKDYLGGNGNENEMEEIRKHTKTGRPAGRDEFLNQLESLTGRRLKKRRPGPRSK